LLFVFFKAALLFWTWRRTDVLESLLIFPSKTSGSNNIDLPADLALVLSLDAWKQYCFVISSGVICGCQHYANIPAINSNNMERVMLACQQCS